MEQQKDIQKDIVPTYEGVNDFYEHAKKIVTALYLLTDLFEDKEPVKWSLRSKIIETMSYTGVLSRSVGPVIKDIDGREILDSVSEIRSLLDIGVLSGLVSPMNHDILSRELLVFQDNAIRHFHLMNGNQSLYTESLFSGFDWRAKEKHPNVSQGHSRTLSQYKRHQKMSKKSFESTLLKKEKKETNPDVSEERKSKILDLIKVKGNIMIKDISSSFPDFSEKTIQRDLLGLVSQGRIQKIGERRWTTYSMAK